MAKVFLHEQSSEKIGLIGSGARLTVRCPADSIVKATQDTIEYIAVSDNLESIEATGVIFDKLLHGTWLISMTDGEQTAKKYVDIVSDYEITIKFFIATLDITYPVGSVCTVTNGDKIFTAPDTSGVWKCVVSDVGTWTVSCTDGYETRSKVVEITHDGQNVGVVLAYFMSTIYVTYPAGTACVCVNEDTIFSAPDTTGYWEIIITRAGDWIVSASNGIQTVSTTVSIAEDGQIEYATINFFAATLNITYPSESRCVVTDGTTTFTAPDTSGQWTVVIPWVGVWTVEAVSGNNSVTKTVEITEDGQVVNVICKFFTSYINVTYPSETAKLILWYVDSYGSKYDVGVDISGSGNYEFIVSKVGNYEIGAYRVPPYVGIESVAGDYVSKVVTISDDEQTIDVSLFYNSVPEFTYTDGTYKLVNDEGEPITETSGDWNIMFLTSGSLKFSKLNGASAGIDVFVLGGGGNGGENFVVVGQGITYTSGGGGGGGGYRESTFNNKIDMTIPYEIIVGGPGGTSSAFGASAAGGSNGSNGMHADTAAGGGDGGTGGSNGGKGCAVGNGGWNGIDGSYAFLGSSGPRYGPGGGGGYGYNGANGILGKVNYGGKDGGGNSGMSATANSGGGGGGASYSADGAVAAGTGGSGIVIIRNRRT